MMMRLLALLAVGALAACQSPCCTTSPDAGADSLFNGKSLGSWKSTQYGGEGPVSIENGCIKVEMGNPLSGVNWTGRELPKTNYEFSVEAMKLDGSDFHCGIIFPVGKDLCSFVAGGWGGSVTGLSSVDNMMADGNETTNDNFNYKKDRWYRFRLRVTPQRIQVFVDQEKAIDLELAGKQISCHPSVESGAPLGISNFTTTSLFRNITLTTIK